MTIKMKKFMVTLLVCMMFSTTAFAAYELIEMEIGTEVTIWDTLYKSSFRDSALIQLTEGPVADRCAMTVQLVRTDNAAYYSKVRTFYECGSKEADYVYGTSDFTAFVGKNFDVKARILKTSEEKTNVIDGIIAP